MNIIIQETTYNMVYWMSELVEIVDKCAYKYDMVNVVNAASGS